MGTERNERETTEIQAARRRRRWLWLLLLAVVPGCLSGIVAGVARRSPEGERLFSSNEVLRLHVEDLTASNRLLAVEMEGVSSTKGALVREKEELDRRVQDAGTNNTLYASRYVEATNDLYIARTNLNDILYRKERAEKKISNAEKEFQSGRKAVEDEKKNLERERGGLVSVSNDLQKALRSNRERHGRLKKEVDHLNGELKRLKQMEDGAKPRIKAF